jgi:hypothetical protein
VTVVSHFLGGSAPESVTGVVLPAGDSCSRQLPERQPSSPPRTKKAKGRESLRTLAPSVRTSRRSGFGYPIPVSFFANFPGSRGFDSAVSRSSSKNIHCESFAAPAVSGRPKGPFESRCRASAKLQIALFVGKISLPLTRIMARARFQFRALFVCKSLAQCGNGG